MTTLSPVLRAELRPVIAAQWINFVLCLSLLSIAFALGKSASPPVWVRSAIILVVGMVMLLCGMQMRRGRRWAYVRAKWIAILGSIGFVGVAALPGPFPEWMRIEQGVQALVFLAMAWMLTRPALVSLFPRVDAPVEAGRANLLPHDGARDASFDYLRAFIVVLVLLHHTVMAYAIMWPGQPTTFKILAAPIVDPYRWPGFDVLLIFNDTFFMALMFLLSGLFVWSSLERKGGAKFLRDRMLRLGVPFVVAVGILMPLAYYPTYAVTGADPSGYVRAWASIGFWPNGPAWFIWMLLVFDAGAAGLYMPWRRWMANAPVSRPRGLSRSPLVFVVLLLVVSTIAYVPLALAVGSDSWLSVGPFTFQKSRPLLYATFFLAGILMGASATHSGFLARNAGLARRWPVWVFAGLAAFALHLTNLVTSVLPFARSHRPLPVTSQGLVDITFVLCCVMIGFALIALFRRFAVTHRPVFDSLSASSYGMYLVHYPVVVWLQFALLAVALGPIAKAIIVFVGSVALSWGIVAALRRVPAIARVI
jgi:peptidoglycan/LPS O-acetylase OafA/YrhL